MQCICYDLAFEPFLQAILQDDDFAGYTLGPHQDPSTHPVPNVNTKLLCYADDALVFIHNRNDLRLLDYYMDLFCRASNAKFNYNKVEAFSLSGRDLWPFWQRQLEAMNIHHLHSRKDDLPLIYLGFPLIQSTTQRQNHVQSTISKLEVAVKLHSIRSLSVVGKATVVNTLLLSKCWYIFRVTALTQQDIQSITGVAIRFLRSGIFPAIPWSTWTLPKDQGGLGILDVQAQYAALYFRWIQPLLIASYTTLDAISPLSRRLIHYINNINHSSHHQVPLLLPTTRHTFLRKTRMATIDIIYKSIDLIPRNFDSVRISHATSLQLPLQAVLYVSPHSSFRLPTKMREMKVLDVFQHNADHHFLHWKDTRDPSLRSWKMAPKKIFNGLASGDILIQPFFQPLCLPSPAPDNGRVESTIDFTPLATSLTFLTGTHTFSAIPTKTFRQACVAAHVPSHLRAINGRAWKSFWSLALTMVQRNVIYRFISNSFPHKSLLHRVFTDLHPSPMCTICSISTETSVHFLFHCPPKATMWRAIIFEFLWPTVSIQDIITAITFLDFYNIRYCQRSAVSAPIIVILTLANIWRAHFRNVFDATPFEAQAVIANIRADVVQRINEDQVHSTL